MTLPARRRPPVPPSARAATRQPANPRRRLRLFALLLALPLGLLATTGCQAILGTSMKHVEKARSQAVRQTFPAPLVICRQAALDAAQAESMLLFVNDLPNQRLMLLHVPGSIDTTEVGVFFTPAAPAQTTVEIASHSLEARDTVARLLFPALEKLFPAAAATATP